MLARCDSSSSGSASCTRGPGSDDASGRNAYSQPVAATSTASESTAATPIRAALVIGEPARGRAVCGARVVAPQGPVVTAVGKEIAMLEPQRLELMGECFVLLAQAVGRAGV